MIKSIVGISKVWVYCNKQNTLNCYMQLLRLVAKEKNTTQLHTLTQASEYKQAKINYKSRILHCNQKLHNNFIPNLLDTDKATQPLIKSPRQLKITHIIGLSSCPSKLPIKWHSKFRVNETSPGTPSPTHQAAQPQPPSRASSAIDPGTALLEEGWVLQPNQDSTEDLRVDLSARNSTCKNICTEWKFPIEEKKFHPPRNNLQQ